MESRGYPAKTGEKRGIMYQHRGSEVSGKKMERRYREWPSPGNQAKEGNKQRAQRLFQARDEQPWGPQKKGKRHVNRPRVGSALSTRTEKKGEEGPQRRRKISRAAGTDRVGVKGGVGKNTRGKRSTTVCGKIHRRRVKGRCGIKERR